MSRRGEKEFQRPKIQCLILLFVRRCRLYPLKRAGFVGMRGKKDGASSDAAEELRRMLLDSEDGEDGEVGAPFATSMLKRSSAFVGMRGKKSEYDTVDEEAAEAERSLLQVLLHK